MAMLDRSNATPTASAMPAACSTLQGTPGDWPHEASAAYWALLRDLNQWCRATGSSTATNALVAEAAVREVWTCAA